MSKEILIPKDKIINGHTVPGFEVYNPLYCLEGGQLSFKSAFVDGGSMAKLDRAGIIVCRGWIPHHKRDRKTRPEDRNTRQLVRLDGCFRPGKNIHNYIKPNNPEANEWYNVALEDFAIFWDMPNWDQCKWYYFDAVDLSAADEGPVRTCAIPKTKEELIYEQYGWYMHAQTLKYI